MTALTDREAAEIEAGNDTWVDRAHEPRDTDPIRAAVQNDRDWYYAAGNYDRAVEQQGVLDGWFMPRQMAFDEPEAEVQ